jgi:hypothetical protein
LGLKVAGLGDDLAPVNHKRRLGGRRANLRRTKGHAFWKALKLLRADWGPKILAIKRGHISRPTSGERVYRKTSPTKGTAGADKATASARKVG